MAIQDMCTHHTKHRNFEISLLLLLQWLLLALPPVLLAVLLPVCTCVPGTERATMDYRALQFEERARQ